MSYRIVPLFSARAEAVMFEVYDEVGHCMILEVEELRDMDRELGRKIIFDNFDVTREDACRMRHEGRRSAHDYAARCGLL